LGWAADPVIASHPAELNATQALRALPNTVALIRRLSMVLENWPLCQFEKLTYPTGRAVSVVRSTAYVKIDSADLDHRYRQYGVWGPQQGREDLVWLSE
jgi:hypothetical protein